MYHDSRTSQAQLEVRATVSVEVSYPNYTMHSIVSFRRQPFYSRKKSNIERIDSERLTPEIWEPDSNSPSSVEILNAGIFRRIVDSEWMDRIVSLSRDSV